MPWPSTWNAAHTALRKIGCTEWPCATQAIDCRKCWNEWNMMDCDLVACFAPKTAMMKPTKMGTALGRILRFQTHNCLPQKNLAVIPVTHKTHLLTSLEIGHWGWGSRAPGKLEGTVTRQHAHRAVHAFWWWSELDDHGLLMGMGQNQRLWNILKLETIEFGHFEFWLFITFWVHQFWPIPWSFFWWDCWKIVPSSTQMRPETPPIPSASSPD